MKILVVDDDAMLREALVVGIELHWGDGAAIEAADGEEGLRRVQTHSPDIVLLDLARSNQPGFELLAAIRQTSDVPVIVLSAHVGEADQLRGLELGADDYLVKPFAFRVLIARIRAIMRRVERRRKGPTE